MMNILPLCVMCMVMCVTESKLQFDTPNDATYYLLPFDKPNTRCHKSVAFQVKSSAGVHVGLKTYQNSNDDMYVILVGGWSNTKSAICRSEFGTELTSHDEVVLSPTEYSPFWVSWEAGVVAVGQGLEVGTDLMMTWTDPSPHRVHYVALYSHTTSPAEWIVETPDCQRLQLERIVPEGLIIPDSREKSNTEGSSTPHACASRCYSLDWCRSFSYSLILQECRMFDKDPIGGYLANNDDWKTWSLRP